MKRRLWQDLLQVALGKDAATAGDDSDWLFIRHTYITSLIAVIMQQQLLGDVAHYASESAGISIDYTFQVKAKLPQLKKAGKRGKKS